ncbi:MAG: tetratricopeptide repeat protein [Endomicrobium sp.]|jgi:tetratricopeptide (TPR) repeat protein|nr:tetratricopeptide repeat protein [Endomicrobium sp.]
MYELRKKKLCVIDKDTKLKRKSNNFRIQYSFMGKTGGYWDVKLEFDDKKECYSFIWADILNNWNHLTSALKKLIYDINMDIKICGGAIFKNGKFDSWGEQVRFIAEFLTEDTLYFSINEINDKGEAADKELCSFVIDKRTFIDEFYKVLVFLATHKRYKPSEINELNDGMLINKYEFLSENIEKYLDPKGFYMKHSNNVLACLLHSAESADDFYNLGLAKYNAKQYKRALKDFNKSIKMRKNDLLVYRERGRTYVNLKQYKKALADFNKAVSIDKNYDLAYNGRGDVYRYLKKYDLAIKEYQKALEIFPDNIYHLCDLGLAYISKKDYSEAVKYFLKSKDIDKNDEYSYRWAGHCKRHLRLFDEAIILYQQSLKIDPNSLGSLAYCARSYQWLGKKREALKMIGKAIKIKPKEKAFLKIQTDIKKGKMERL